MCVASWLFFYECQIFYLNSCSLLQPWGGEFYFHFMHKESKTQKGTSLAQIGKAGCELEVKPNSSPSQSLYLLSPDLLWQKPTEKWVWGCQTRARGSRARWRKWIMETIQVWKPARGCGRRSREATCQRSAEHCIPKQTQAVTEASWYK